MSAPAAMPMRGGSRRAADTISISPRAFAWDRCAVATLRHSTLPWSGVVPSELSIRATPLSSAGQLGRRDRLSLLAQFAAHQGLVRFAGIVDGEFDPAEWAVAQKRGADCRLIRLSARSAAAEAAPPALTVAQQFGDFVKAPPLDALRRSWARADAIYVESFKRLREDAVADLNWARRAAVGSVLAPGVEALRDVAARRETRFSYDDAATVEALESLRALDPALRIVVLRGRAITRYGALDGLRALGIADLERLSEGEIAERVAAVLPSQPVIFAVVDPQAFDPASSRVVQLLASAGDAAWVTPGQPATLPRTRWYVAASRLAAAREFEQQLVSSCDRAAVLDEFLGGPALEEFLDRGLVTIGDSRLKSINEPVRSYIAALALLGDSIPLANARRLLAEFMYERPLEQLVVADVTRIENDSFVFASEAVRRAVAQLMPQTSRAAICRVAAAIAAEGDDLTRAAALLLEAGETREAVAMLERVSWASDGAVIAALGGLLRGALAASPQLASRYADALVRAARYADARDIADALAPNDRELVLAVVERRTGDYGSALGRLERMPRSCQSDLLRAEILSVERRDGEAAALLKTSVASNEDERVRLGYARALVAGGADRTWMKLPSRLARYYAARLETYRALDEGAVDTALRAIAVALAAADSVVERVDVLMDQVFALFSSGRWADARRAALEALAVVEETQGDRAAGGLLFLLAYLAADDGQWAHAAQRISRLRHFYGITRDERHLAELDLLNAHLEFSCGRFGDARRLASPLVSPAQDEPIRLAAALIVDEADWIAGGDASMALEKVSSNAEFADRMKLMAARSGHEVAAFNGSFNAALARWERAGGAAPEPECGSESLKLYRSFLSLGRRRRDAALLGRAKQIAEAMRLAVDAPSTNGEPEVEVRILRAVVIRDYPFAPHDLDCAWRYAVRNRLDQWSEIGSLPPLPPAQLDQIARSSAKDWMACSDRELLYIDGMSAWTREGRDAVGVAFRARAELHRLRRIVEQEQSTIPAQRPSLTGIVGDSPAIRAVIERAALVARRDVAVCLFGESGTGKELMARAVHAGSPRRHKPFTPVNCGALPENLIESELFGHVRGAFTGADRDRAGLIEASDGGTLFLDEIGEMPLVAQAKLLRFLQEGEFRRVGDTANRAADVRIVTATNRKLDEAVENGRFREDLYYRVAGIEIVLPPLRERGNDVLALASHFLAIERDRHRSGPARFSPEVESLLAGYSWPGNVRELQNAVRGAHAVAGEAREIAVEHLPDRLRSAVATRNPPGSYQDAVARFRRDLIERALGEANGNQNRAAAMLKISRQALGYQIRELGILVGKTRPRSNA